ncbi:MAG: (2Fe-2S)-binding protein [Hahellaceae bacterium]|nr:(2Fe-2S)-binding protein [Hahellaceae bacterium]
MIVCVCLGISDKEIRQRVQNNNATYAELRKTLGIGTCCGQCTPMTKAIVKDHLDTSNNFGTDINLAYPA